MAKRLPDSMWRVPGTDESMPAVAVKEPPAEPQSPEVAAAETRRLLEDQGWCLWRCSTLADEVIVVVRDELVTGYPPGYPVYTTQELLELTRDGVGVTTIRLAHEAKKGLGCKVAAVEAQKQGRRGE